MTERDRDAAMRRLEIEVAVNRLVLRAAVGHLIVTSRASALDTITGVRAAVDAMAAEAALLDTGDETVHAAAADLVRARAAAFLDTLAARPPQSHVTTDVPWPESEFEVAGGVGSRD